jgi:RNA polymerase sigma-70 factor (ECF subfamily)
VYKVGVPFLHQALRYLGVAEADRDDVLQDVLLAAYRGLDRYDASRSSRAHPTDGDPALLVAPIRPFGGFKARRSWSPLQGWLFGIAWRQVTHYRDRAHRRREIPMGLHDSAIFAEVDERSSLDQHVENAERAQLISVLLATMIPQRRAIVVMHDMLDIPVADIARQFEINENTAQNRLRLGREDFRAAAKRLNVEKRATLRPGERPFSAEAMAPRHPAKPRVRRRS